MNNLVTIITFGNLSDSYILQTILESYEIPFTIKDELMGQIYTAIATGGIKLQVLESDYKRAKEVLEQAGYVVDN